MVSICRRQTHIWGFWRRPRSPGCVTLLRRLLSLWVCRSWCAPRAWKKTSPQHLTPQAAFHDAVSFNCQNAPLLPVLCSFFWRSLTKWHAAIWIPNILLLMCYNFGIYCHHFISYVNLHTSCVWWPYSFTILGAGDHCGTLLALINCLRNEWMAGFQSLKWRSWQNILIAYLTWGEIIQRKVIYG